MTSRFFARSTGHVLCLLLIGGAPVFAAPTVPAGAVDVSARLEKLGQPSLERYPTQFYARNVWDLQLFDGRLYIGGGNSSNEGPNSNAGPVPIWSFNPRSGAFSTEFSVDDEQTENFHVLNGQLTLPGHDPREDWSKGNFYRLEANAWKKYRTIPNGIHTYDLAQFGGKMYAGLGTDKDFQLAASSDKGATWQTFPTVTGRTFTLGEFEGRLMAWGSVPSLETWKSVRAINKPETREAVLKDLGWSVGEFSPDGTLAPRPDLTADVVFPGAAVTTAGEKLVRPTVWNKRLLYIGGAPHNDHQTDPFALYVADSLRPGKVSVHRIALGKNDKPWDIAASRNAVYVLTSEKIERAGAPDEFMVRVWMSRDTRFWSPLLQFSAPTFARSMEFDGRHFYFGMGTDVGPGFPDIPSYTRDLRPEAGQIWRVADQRATR